MQFSINLGTSFTLWCEIEKKKQAHSIWAPFRFDESRMVETEIYIHKLEKNHENERVNVGKELGLQ